jgi:hypothetical protein
VSEEGLEVTKGVIRIRKSKKDRQQMKNDKRTNSLNMLNA